MRPLAATKIENSAAALTVRDSASTPPMRIPRDPWTISANSTITLKGGFEPGRTYEITYKAANPAVAGLGFAAVRDVASWLRRGADSILTESLHLPAVIPGWIKQP